MVELPRGTVTFLLTDVEGSTALWDQARETMPAALARHDELFEQVVAAHRGIHVRPRGEGDSRFAVFAGAVDAVSAALAFQQLLRAEPWPTPRPIAVRIGVHTGHAVLRDGDYYGATVNRCARIRNLGRGGETLLSDATVAVLRDDLPRGVVLRDLGRRRLRGLARPERVFRLAESVESSGTASGRPPGRILGRTRRRRALSALGFAAVVLGIMAAVVLWARRTEIVLLADDFNLPDGRMLPEVSDYPNEFAVGYGGGEYTIQSISLSRDRIPSVLLPGWYADASLSIDARVIGEPESQSVMLGCRNVGPRTGYRLTVRPAHGSGSLDRSDGIPVLIRLAPVSNAAAIRRRTAINRLELRCIDDTISAFVNGTQVASVRDTTYRAGRLWIGANVDADTVAFGHALFDNLLVRGVPAAVSPEQFTSPPTLPAQLPTEAN